MTKTALFKAYCWNLPAKAEILKEKLMYEKMLMLKSPAAVRTKNNGTNLGFQRAGRTPITSHAEHQTAQREITLDKWLPGQRNEAVPRRTAGQGERICEAAGAEGKKGLELCTAKTLIQAWAN